MTETTTEQVNTAPLDLTREFMGRVLSDEDLAHVNQRGYVWFDHMDKGQREVTLLSRFPDSGHLYAALSRDPQQHDELIRAEELSLRSVVALEKIAEQLQASNVLAQALVEQAAV